MVDKENKGKFRKISKEKYVVAGIITALIFFLGLMLGFIMEDQRYQTISEINQEQEVSYLSLQLQYLYLSSSSNYDNCPILSATLKDAVEDLSNSLSKVIAYEEENNIADKNRGILTMRRYALDNLRYWLLASESKKKCDLNIATILYFYSSECPSCPNQGTILTYFKKLFGEQVLVFPINLDLREEEAMVDVTALQFNVTKYPTIVIDDQKYEGVVRKEQLQGIICSSLENSEHCPE